MPTTRNSASYLALEVNHGLADPRDEGGTVYHLPFKHTVGTEASGDLVLLRAIPKGCLIVGLDLAFDALGASTTMSVGDTESATRFINALAVTTAGKSNGLLSAGQNFIATVNTILTITWGGATPTAAAVVQGILRIMRSA